MSLLGIVRNQHLVLLFAIQLVTSLSLIYYCKNKLSYVTEILFLLLALWYNRPVFELETVICYLVEYLLVKVFLVLIVWASKHFSFKVLVIISHKNKYKVHYNFLITKKHFLRIQSRIWNKVDYGIRIKKGMPSMVNRRHQKTGIYFDSNGFPKFQAIAEVKLNRKYWKKERSVHFYKASKLLYEKAKKYRKVSKNFTKKELALFEKGDLPYKYTWHHHQDAGVLQLVDREIHSEVRHNGGYFIWGKRE